jgi:hypothetical protein
MLREDRTYGTCEVDVKILKGHSKERGFVYKPDKGGSEKGPVVEFREHFGKSAGSIIAIYLLAVVQGRPCTWGRLYRLLC